MHYTHTRMAKIKGLIISNMSEFVQKIKGRLVKPLQKPICQDLLNVKNIHHTWLSNSVSMYSVMRNKCLCYQNTCTKMFNDPPSSKSRIVRWGVNSLHICSFKHPQMIISFSEVSWHHVKALVQQCKGHAVQPKLRFAALQWLWGKCTEKLLGRTEEVTDTSRF